MMLLCLTFKNYQHRALLTVDWWVLKCSALSAIAEAQHLPVPVVSVPVVPVPVVSVPIVPVPVVPVPDLSSQWELQRILVQWHSWGQRIDSLLKQLLAFRNSLHIAIAGFQMQLLQIALCPAATVPSLSSHHHDHTNAIMMVETMMGLQKVGDACGWWWWQNNAGHGRVSWSPNCEKSWIERILSLVMDYDKEPK